jgi:hypothetical protein
MPVGIVVRVPTSGARDTRLRFQEGFRKGSVQRIARRCILFPYRVYKFGRRAEERAGR